MTATKKVVETEKPNSTAIAPPTANSGSTPTAAEPVKRQQRMKWGKDKKLAFAMAGLVAILLSEPVAKLLTPEQKAKVEKAKTQADELGGDPFKGINENLTAVIAELKKLDYSKDPVAVSARAVELGKEVDRLTKRKAEIEKLISAA